MIKVETNENGVKTDVEGNVMDIMVELGYLIHSLKKQVPENLLKRAVEAGLTAEYKKENNEDNK